MHQQHHRGPRGAELQKVLQGGLFLESDDVRFGGLALGVEDTRFLGVFLPTKMPRNLAAKLSGRYCGVYIGLEGQGLRA